MSATQRSRIDAGAGSRPVGQRAASGVSRPPEAPVPKSPWWKSRKLLLMTMLALLCILLLGALGLSMGNMSGSDQQLVFYPVKRGDLPITVVERGNLDSQEKVEIFCELENLSYDRSGTSGTQILYIVPNGESVKKGDLLVEFDSAALQDRLDSQVLALERARAEKLQADARYDNQITQNETSKAEAELKVELANLSLESFEDEDGGTFQLSLQDVDMQIQEAQAKNLIQETELNGVEELYRLGYKSKGDLAKAQLDALTAQRSLATAISRRKKTTIYDYEKDKLVLKGDLETSKRSLLQVQRDNESELAQALAAKNAADRSLEKEIEKHDKYTEQLGKCKIYAPQDGMVAYAVPERYGRGFGSSSQLIAEGAFVRERQKILTLPSLTKMEVNTAVHESVLDQVKVGLPATIRLDAFVDRTYKGAVKSVAVMPDQGGWLSSDTKVYSTVVTIGEEVQGLKPGMTAVVEIHVERLKDVLSVPVQAIVQVGGKNWCYVSLGGGVERRDLELGKTNDKFVEIVKGLEGGDRVVLNPMAIVDQDQKEAEEAKEEGSSEGVTGADQQEEAAPGSSSTDAGAPAAAPAPDAAPPLGGAAGEQPQRPGPPRAGGPAGSRGEGPPGSRGEGSPGQGRGQRRGFSMTQLDKDGDGKLSREELPEQMAPMFSRLDANADGFLDAEEMAAMRRNRSRGGGSGGRGFGRGGGGGDDAGPAERGGEGRDERGGGGAGDAGRRGGGRGGFSGRPSNGDR